MIDSQWTWLLALLGALAEAVALLVVLAALGVRVLPRPGGGRLVDVQERRGPVIEPGALRHRRGQPTGPLPIR